MDALRDQHLVVFGCGYIGGAVARQALARGLHVTALTRNSETAAALTADGAEVVVADLATADWHDRIPGGAEYVLNAVSAGAAGLAGYRHSYVDGMRSILNWARARGRVGTLVYTSSTSVYPQSGGAVVNEEASHDGVGERGEILLEAENLLWADDTAKSKGAARSSDMGGTPMPPATAGKRGTGVPPVEFHRGFIFRLAGIYGPGRHYLADQVRSGSVAGVGDHRLNLIHREDACAAIWAAFTAPASISGGIFNLADDCPSRKADVVAWLAERLRVPVPQFSGVPAGTRRALTPDRVISNAKLKRSVGWRPQFPDFRSGYENILSPPVE